MFEAWLRLWLWWLPEPVVERLGVDDASDAALIHAASFHSGWPADDIAGMIRDEAMFCYGVRAAMSAPLAGFLLVRCTLDEAEVMTIAVSMRGRGYGRRLMQALWPDLAAIGIRTIFLEVEAGNLAALALYRKEGFTEFGRRKNYYAGRDGRQDAILMQKTLR